MPKTLKKRTFKVILGLTVFLVVWMFFAKFMAENLIVEKEIESPEALLILGGSAVYEERAEKAVEVYQRGKRVKIFLIDDDGKAGWSQTEQRNPKFVELAEKELLAKGVLAEDIEILPHIGDGTNYEAKLFAEKAEERRFEKVLLVTSAYHTSRTLWTFEKFFKDRNLKTEIGVVSPILGKQTPTSFSWWLSGKGWKMVAGEYVKFVYYWFFL